MTRSLICATVTAPTTAELRRRRDEVVDADLIELRLDSLSDCVPLLEVGAQAGRHGGLVLVAMGEYGVATRVLAGRFGSMWTYAGLEHDVGQLTPSTLVDEFHFRSLTESTGLYGLVGSPVAHSASPAMHNAAFRASRLDAVYLPFHAVDTDDFITFARAIGLKGASV